MRAALLAVVQLAIVSAFSPVEADAASDRLNLAHQVVVVAHVADDLRNLMPVFMAQFRPLVLQGRSDTADFDEFIKLFNARVDAGADQYAEKVGQIYATEFSAEDLGNLLAFYKTPTGQNLLAKENAVAQAYILVGKQFGQDLAKQVVEDMNKEKQAKPSKM